MIEFIGLNYWAILLAWFVNIAIGSVWYSPIGFQKLWSRLSGVDMAAIPKDEANRAIGFVAVSALIQAIILAVVLHSMHIMTVASGAAAGLLLWFGLTAVTTIGNTLYSRLSLKFWWLNASFFLVVMVLNGMILAAL